MRPYSLHRTLAVIAFALFVIASSKADASEGTRFRYRYKPVEAHRFRFSLRVQSELDVNGDKHEYATTMVGTARIIVFKIDSLQRFKAMAMIDSGTLVRRYDDNFDSTTLTIWTLKRIEMTFESNGILKQIFDVEKMPPLLLQGFAESSETGLRAVLRSLIPHLPDSLSADGIATTTATDSLTYSEPDRVVKRKTVERTTFTHNSPQSDTLWFNARSETTEDIYPKNAERAMRLETRASKGLIRMNEGRLIEYTHDDAVYRSIAPVDPRSVSRIEESTTIKFRMAKQ